MAPFSCVSVVLLYLHMVASHAIGNQVCADDDCGAEEAQAQAVDLLQKEIQHVTEGSAKTDKGISCTDYTSQYNGYDDKKVNGATDKDGDACSFYAGKVEECGKYDDEDFIAKEMCCNCGGGSTSVISRSIAVNSASVFISEGSDCPSGFEPITTVTACRAALDMVGFSGSTYWSASSESDWPKGCYYCKNTQDCGEGVWFNSHSSGQTVTGTHRFCQKGYDPASVQVLFVGDSDIDYWDSSVAFPGSFNVGIGGYTTADVIKEVDQWVADLDPKWAIIVCGENDIGGQRTDTTAAFERFKLIVGKLIGDGARVIYLGTKPEPESKSIYTEYKYYDAQVRKFASELAQDKANPPFQMIDVFPSFTSKWELYNSDGLHMSRLGYAFWNGWVKLAMSSPGSCIRWRDGVCVERPAIKYD